MTLTTLFHLLLHVVCVLHQSNAFSMNIFPIDSNHLQILPNSFTVQDRHHFLRNISLSRASKSTQKLGLDSTHTPLFSNLQPSYFVTQLVFGDTNPPLAPFLILDTSADVTWIQSADCENCFDLKPSFKVNESSTFSRLDLEDTRCIPQVNFEGSCGFESDLGPGHTEGYLGMDTFLFNDSSGYFPNIAFGCGVNNSNFSFSGGPDNVIAGVHGLGLGPKSMMTQLDMDIQGRFTYCIRPDNGTSTIYFGDDAQIVGAEGLDVQTIAMNPEARYHLYMAGITVQGNKLQINPIIFQLNATNYTSGFFIDPSAAFTVLTNTAYAALRGAVVDYFTNEYKWDPLPSDPNNIFDLCYSDVPDGQSQVYPEITFDFVKSPGTTSGEVKLLFDSSNIFGNFGNKNGFCMQILSTPDSEDGPSVLGAFQQANIQFLYDIKTRLLSFVPKDCKV